MEEQNQQRTIFARVPLLRAGMAGLFTAGIGLSFVSNLDFENRVHYAYGFLALLLVGWFAGWLQEKMAGRI